VWGACVAALACYARAVGHWLSGGCRPRAPCRESAEVVDGRGRSGRCRQRLQAKRGGLYEPWP